MNVWKSNEWVSYVDYYIDNLRQQTKVQLNDHDWDDLKQRALVRIWNKRKNYTADKPFRPWLKTVVCNCYRNYLRDNVFFKHKGKQSIRKTYPLVDVLHSETTDSYEEFISTLEPLEQKVIGLYADSYSTKEIAKQINKHYQFVYQVRRNVRIKYWKFKYGT